MERLGSLHLMDVEANHDRLIPVGQLLVSILLLVSALWLPWATYRTGSMTLIFRNGSLDLVLVVCGAVALISATISLGWNHAPVHWLLFAIGCVAVISSLALALTKIKAANDHASSVATGFSRTSYGFGSALGVAASVLLVVLSVMQLRSLRSRKAVLPSREGHAVH
jgi:hypothetical protein